MRMAVIVCGFTNGMIPRSKRRKWGGDKCIVVVEESEPGGVNDSDTVVCCGNRHLRAVGTAHRSSTTYEQARKE